MLQRALAAFVFQHHPSYRNVATASMTTLTHGAPGRSGGDTTATPRRLSTTLVIAVTGVTITTAPTLTPHTPGRSLTHARQDHPPAASVRPGAYRQDLARRTR